MSSKNGSGKVPARKIRSVRKRTMSQNDMIELYAKQGVFIDQRIIMLTSRSTDVDGGESGTDVQMWEQFMVNLDILTYFDRFAPITVRMNNVGGYWYHGKGIFGAILNSRAPISIFAYGPIMSVGSVILQAAHHRLIDRDATMLLHYTSESFDGHSKELERLAEESKRVNTELEDIYLDQMVKKDSGTPREELRKKLQEMMKYDYYVDARKAVALGLADGFIPRPAPPRLRKQETDETETPTK